MSAPMQEAPQQAPQPTQMPAPPQGMPSLPNGQPGPMGAPIQGQSSAVTPVTIDQVVQLLRDDDMRGFRIDVETDQMVQGDEDADKQRAIEFVTATGQFLGEFGPLVVQMPPLAPLASELLTFAVRRFKVGRQLEDVIEQTMQQVSERLGNPQPPPPSPEDQAKIATAQTHLQIAQIKAQAEGQKAQIDAQAMVQGHQADLQAKAIDVRAKQSQADLALQQAQQAHKHAMEKAAADLAASAQAHDLEQARLEAAHRRAMELHHAKMAEMQTAGLMAVESHALAKDDKEHSAQLAERQTEAKEVAAGAKPSKVKKKLKIVRDASGRIDGVEEA